VSSKREPGFPATVLVLGATSSIAIAFMRQLADGGRRFMLVGRSTPRLTAVAQDLTVRGAAAVDTWVMDIDDTAAHAEMLSTAAQRLGKIDLALIAHGVLGDQHAAEADFEVAAAILHTNFLATVSLLTWLGNYFQAQGSGTLAVISSVAGDRGRKSNYVYGASKGALNIFLEGLRNRIDRDGVQVLTIKPGFVATPMTAHVEQNLLFASPEKVARGILRAVEQRRDVAYVPGFWALIMFLVRAIPGFQFKKMNL
jgi:short-subunit dehydrogenase